MDIESDDSERWEDFFGSSTDLTPSLIGLYDSLTGSLNEAQNHKVITEASEEEICNNHDHNIQLKQQPHQQSTTDDTTAAAAAATNTTTIPSSTITTTTTTTTKITTNSITNTSSDNNFSVNIEDEDTVVVDKNKIHSSNTINNNTNISSSKHRSFRILSPNVQRLISHSNTTTIVGKLESLESSVHNQIQCNNNTLNSSSSNGTNISSSNYSTTITNSNNNNNNNISYNSIRSLRKIIGKHKLSHIPLSRNTCKLTQAGNELVETFETSSSSSSSSLSNNVLKLSCESLDHIIIPTLIVTSPPSSLENHLEMNKLSSEINETTTTTTKTTEININKEDNNKFEMCSKENNSDRKSPSITMGNITTSSLSLSSKSEIDKISTTTHPVAKNRVAEIAKFFHLSSSSSMTTSSTSPIQELLQNSSINEDDTEEIGHLPSIDKQLINESAILQYESILNNSSVDVKDFNQKNDIKSSVNKISNDDNIPKIEITASSIETIATTTTATAATTTTTTTTTTPTTASSISSAISLSTTSKKYTPPSSPLLTYARAKVLAANNKPLSLVVGGINTQQQQQQQQQQRITRKLSIENLDKDMKILTTTSTILGNNQHGTTLSPKCNRKSNLILPDIAKLKHRPLSSSSICSTSSSSSSGSDNLLNGKLGVSYLASVESLADQSENELLDGHNNNHGLSHHHHNNLTVFERACLEIIDSERSYVEDLRQIITGYLEDWKERACLKLDELKILFSNIQEIYDFNSILLKQLINSGMDPLKIAKCFIELKNNFTVYTIYCTSYPEAISLLTQLLQASHTNALLTSTQKMLQHTLPLGSYLLKPVQRILKYHLLLDNLRKHCDIEEVVQAYDIMRQVARDIDQVKRKLEQQSRVKELSGILDGWLGPELTVLGELRQEGLLMENNKARMVFLFQTMLIITKPKEDNRLQFKSYIYRNNLMLREHLPGEPTSFNVIPYDEPRNQIKLTAKNRDQKKLWAQNIKGVILEQFDIPNRAKELVYKLGDEEDRTPDKNIWKWNFNSSTPVYLERRNQYRRSELRSRSKSKRKFLTNSTSFEGFLDNKNKNDDFEDNNEDKRHQLLRKQSIDDTMISSLSNHHHHHHHHHSFHHKNHHDCNNSQNECNCDYDLIKNENRNIMRIKSYISNGKPIKERSKSVPRIPSSITQNVDGDSDDEYFIRCSTSDRKKIGTNNNNINNNNNNNTTTSTLGRTKSSKSIEFKNYTTKSIPKRIANLKKSRQKKETSKFYMDLNDFEDTVLKITESSENLSVQEKPNDELKSTIENSLLSIEMSKDNNKEETEEAEEAEEEEEKNKEIILENIDEMNKSEEIIENIEKFNELHNKIDDIIDGKSKNDMEIISELLKDKGFDRILKKPPKKRSFDNGRHLSSPEPNDIGEIIINSIISTSTLPSPSKTPPPPPPSSPPPLNTEDDDEENINNLPKKNLIHDLEPIYESLLRNVHVPYKFSPILNRSKSQQYYTNTFNELKLTKCSIRPESDYVTLVYTENGDLHSIDNAIVKRIVSTDILRNSDSNINYENVTEIETNINNTSSTNQVTNSFSSENDLQEQTIKSTHHKNLIQRLISSKVENVSISENSLLPRVRKSVDNINLGFGKHNKPPERRVSDVTEMCRQSIIHRQGSEAVGERMANLDYVDPKTLFSNSVNSSAISLNPQRDSVFSLTSSNDSVCDSKRKQSQNEISSFIYEDNVEACLENDFRDSAVYSDDNERRQDIYENQNNDNNMKNNIKLKRPSSPPPPPPPPRRNFASNNGGGGGGMKITSPVSPIPPPIPAKPNLPSLKRAFSSAASPLPITTISPTIVTSTDNNIKTFITDSITKTTTTTTTTTTATAITTTTISPTGSGGKSWVLLQIENFNK